MNRKKLSCILTVTMIATQFNYVAFAYEGNNNLKNDTDVIIEDATEGLDSIEDANTSDSSVDENITNDLEDSDTDSNEDLQDGNNSLEGDVDNTEDTAEDDGENPENDENTTEDTEEELEAKNNGEGTVDSNLSGKLELDINFSMPIKNVNKDQTKVSVKLLKDSEVLGTIDLGNDNTSGNIGDITYSLKALDGKRAPISEDAEELNFYYLTFNNLELGQYSLEIEGQGYAKTVVDSIEIQTSSKRVKVGSVDNGAIEQLSDDGVESYPGAFLAGEINGDGIVSKDDYDAVKEAIKSGEDDHKYDINKDQKVDITDLSYVHKNMGKSNVGATILATSAIINPENVEISLGTEISLGEGQNIKNILTGVGSKVSLSVTAVAGQEAPEISEVNPITLPINLAGTATYRNSGGANVETVVIKAPSETRPSSGVIVIGGEEYKYDENNVKKNVAKTLTGEAIDEIIIDLGKQVAVSEITIKVTGSRGNKNLTEIAQVEFLNNVYKELPKPDMNIPVINNFTSTTAVGSESMNIEWNHEANVTGYEIKVEEVNETGEIKSTQSYKTSENSLKITQVQPYGIYRFSIQSLNGSYWESGYKDEQDNYNAESIGDTNLSTNKNDKDGIADNVDTNYIPKAWNSITGNLDINAKEEVDNQNYFGQDSIIELQVIPESVPEGPEAIVAKGDFGALNVSWKAHKKAKDYDLYYRKVGDGAWIKANDPNQPKYEDYNTDNNIPDGVANLDPDEKVDSDELIRGTSYKINDLEHGASYEIKMTATNHHGTGPLSSTYLGLTRVLEAPNHTKYKKIDNKHVEKVTVLKGATSNNDPMSIVDGDMSTSWTLGDWDGGVYYGQRSPIVTFDKEYTFDTIRFTTKLDGSGYSIPNEAKLRIYSEDDKSYDNPIKVIGKEDITVSKKTSPNNVTYVEVKLKEPVTAKQFELNLSAYSASLSISEMNFYYYDSLENDVTDLFADDLRVTLKDTVTQQQIDEFTKRAKTIDPVSLEYHPKQEMLLRDLELAQNLLNDVNLSQNVKVLDASILTNSPNLGQGNAWQSLGVVAKPGDEISIYVGTEAGRQNSRFEVLFTQNYAESGTWSSGVIEIGVGKNDIQVPQGSFNMDVEKGGNIYIRPVKNFYDKQNIQVRVSGATEIPHLNVNNIITDTNKEQESKTMIRQYIRELKLYVSDLPSLYPTVEDKVNNEYTYDPETSVLNSTEIESERVMLSLTATEVLEGVQSGLGGNEDAEVNRLYDALLAWEQLMEISYSLKGVIENPIDFNSNGKIDNDKSDSASLIDGSTEQAYFDKHRAPRSRINIKNQRMFTGAFMYASSHHVGIGFGSNSSMVSGVPFKFDSNGNIINPNEGSLYGWGIGHEIGHVQDAPGLTQAEVTNNILALIAQTFNGTAESRLEGGKYLTMYEKVTSGSVGATSDIFAKLGMYWQLHLAYENNQTYDMLQNNKDTDPNNDSFYAKLYRVGRTKAAAPSESGFNSVEQTFIMRASDAAGRDLREFFKRWGILASPKTNAYLDEMNYPEETRAIYYLNDEARRRRLDTSNTETMAQDTKVVASFGKDKNGNEITNKTYLNQKEVPLILSVTKDVDKILGYEIIRRESTVNGVKETPVGFVERDRSSLNGETTYVDTIDAINNRTLGYKVVAYDYDLNKTEETSIGEIKVTHDGSIDKKAWILDTNTVNDEDEVHEDHGHGTVQDGVITRINDNNPDTVFQGMKDGKEDPHVIIDLTVNKSLVGLTYTAPKVESKKFSIMNWFSNKSEKVYKPISKYEVYTSMNGQDWTLASSGTLDESKTTQTIYFSEDGKTQANQLWANNARYVKLVAKGNTEISIAELDLLIAAGDNVEIGVDNNDQVYKNGIGRAKSDYEYAPGKVIPKGSIVVTGEYRGNPAFNVPLVLNENDENFALESKAILLATLPENAELGEVAEGNWIYWIEPQNQGQVDVGNGLEENLEGTSIKAELYRYNKLNESGAPVGQRLVSDTFLYDLPSNLDDLPQIEFNSSARTFSTENKTVIEINSDLMNETYKNR